MTGLPLFVSAGEALTDMLRTGPAEWQSRVGGAGLNVALAMARLGVSSAFAGAVSTDVLGDAIARVVADAGLDLRFLQRRSQAPLLAMVHETSPPDYFFIGNNSADLHFGLAELPAGWETHVRRAHFGGISLAREPLAGRLIALATGLKDRGVGISYDPNFRKLMNASYDPVLAAMVKLADVIKVSDEDLRGLFRTSDVAAAFGRLRAMNPDASVLFTRGAVGAEFHARGQAWRAAAPRVAVVDTIGAGDASISALLHGLMSQTPADGAHLLRWAVAAGAAACTLPGATPPTLDQIAAIAPAVEVFPVC